MASEFRPHRKLARDESTTLKSCSDGGWLVRERSKVEWDSKTVKPTSLRTFHWAPPRKHHFLCPPHVNHFTTKSLNLTQLKATAPPASLPSHGVHCGRVARVIMREGPYAKKKKQTNKQTNKKFCKAKWLAIDTRVKILTICSCTLTDFPAVLNFLLNTGPVQNYVFQNIFDRI